MYQLGDERAAIREIQKYLHFVSDRVASEVPRIAIDGIYGDETKEAVIAYQRYKGIDESGAVDYETFTLLYEDFQLARALFNSESYFIDEKHLPMKRGAFGKDAFLINMMLDEFRQFYKEIGRVDLKPYFSIATERAVIDLRKIFMLATKPYVDLEMYDRMINELQIRNREKVIFDDLN